MSSSSEHDDSEHNVEESDTSSYDYNDDYVYDFTDTVEFSESIESIDDVDNDTISFEDDKIKPFEDDSAKLSRCNHYNRGCHLLYNCCNEYFPCRFCHDDAKNSYELDVKLMHNADRRTVNTVKCRYCLTEQPISIMCINTECGRMFGNYYCTICKLIDLDDKGQFHCDSCNICRQGGKDNYEHCNACGICIPVESTDIDNGKDKNKKHKCSLKIEGDCPICCSSLFSSTLACSAARCGHWMHSSCLAKYGKTNNRCPLCFKSLSDTNAYNAFIDKQIEATPMPDEYKDTMVDIMCNDCSAKSNIKLHFYGLKCAECGNYNTRRL